MENTKMIAAGTPEGEYFKIRTEQVAQSHNVSEEEKDIIAEAHASM